MNYSCDNPGEHWGRLLRNNDININDYPNNLSSDHYQQYQLTTNNGFPDCGGDTSSDLPQSHPPAKINTASSAPFDL